MVLIIQTNVFCISVTCLWSAQSDFMAPLWFLICELVQLLFLVLVDNL